MCVNWCALARAAIAKNLLIPRILLGPPGRSKRKGVVGPLTSLLKTRTKNQTIAPHWCYPGSSLPIGAPRGTALPREDRDDRRKEAQRQQLLF